MHLKLPFLVGASLVITIVIAGLALAAFSLSRPAQNAGDQPEQIEAIEHPRITEDDWGQIVTLEEARNKVEFEILVPSSLPEGLTLERVRTKPGMVTFFYSNNIKIIQAKEDETVNTTRLIEALAEKSPRMKLFNSSGAEGVGHDPWVQIYEGERIDNPGQLNFWMDGIHYNIIGDLSFDEMVKIAISMLES